MRKHNCVIWLSLVEVVPSFEDMDNDWTMVEFNEVKMLSALRGSLAFQGLSLKFFRMKAYSVRVCVRTCVRASVSTACCLCLHQPHNHISLHCIRAAQPSPRHPVLACLHLVVWKPWRCCFCTLFTALTFGGGSTKPASSCETWDVWTPDYIRGQMVDFHVDRCR